MLKTAGLALYARIKELDRRMRCRGCGVRAKGDISITWRNEAT
jgi:hypothetical protein